MAGKSAPLVLSDPLSWTDMSGWTDKGGKPLQARRPAPRRATKRDTAPPARNMQTQGDGSRLTAGYDPLTDRFFRALGNTLGNQNLTENLRFIDNNLFNLSNAENAAFNFGRGEGTLNDAIDIAFAAPLAGVVAKPLGVVGRGLRTAARMTPGAKRVANLATRVAQSRPVQYMTEARPLLDNADDAIETTFSAVPARAAAPRSLAARPTMVEPQRGSTAYGTYELAPGVMTRHRQDVLADEGLREQFSLDPATSWQTAEGTDTLYDVLGMPQSPTVRMTGIYKPDVPGAVEESNIGFSARPRLRIGPDGNPIPEDYNAMSGAEAVRAVADTQGAGAWSMPTRPSDPEQAGALFIPTGAPTDLQRLLDLRERGKKYGLSDIGDLGEGVLMTNFDGLPLGSETAAALRRPVTLGQDNLGLDVRQVLGAGARPQMVGTIGDYIALEKAWMQPEGSGAVSEILRKYLGDLTPPQREAMLEDPRVAQQFGQRFLRDEQARRAGVPVREDVQRTREAIAEQERLQALFDLIARGRPAMAQGGLVAAGE